jgi:hypothetical protein
MSVSLWTFSSGSDFGCAAAINEQFSEESLGFTASC